ncbi:MAG: 23S rRNA (uracil(1939)-C(5))-methyltransferase RlmD [Alphaproteobacteria bacterium]|nr:23S rRNA (uracil(1939)-C(5))-methyltransferase RlmD [Alphaproteobacteria bacterium]
MSDGLDLTIAEIGARGDGIAFQAGEKVFVPYTLPGERVRARLSPGHGATRASVVEILAPAETRVDPPCPHFGRCGGCALQHMAEPAYAAWKQAQVVTALARQGLEDVPVAAPILSPTGSRRRAALKAVRLRDRIVLGFNARLSREVVDVAAACPILDARLEALLPKLKDLLATVMTEVRRFGLITTVTDSGIDLVVVSEGEPSAADREHLAGFAEAEGLARISWRAPQGAPEPVIQRHPVTQDFGGVPVALPPDAFLQATRDGEAALLAFILEAVQDAERIADLYAGCGTFSFPLAKIARVHAADGAAPLIAAMRTAANTHGLAGRLEAEIRDLARRPLSAAELTRFDAVLFDPPRAGAKPQAQEIASSTVPTVVAISCNPATFARDARILVDGGYRLVRIQPVDQFLWSHHLELAALFRREDG